MLSYSHGYHAGNFADVLKHLILVRLLRYLTGKERPLCYFETHAGAGCYPLTSPQALQNREFDRGIGRLWSRAELPDAVADYVDLVRECNGNDRLHRYPGSPWFAARLLRPTDRLILHERHPAEVALLRGMCARDSRARIIAGDGCSGLIPLLPPRERRGLILFDPSYEIKADYTLVAATLVRAHRRFTGGTYALWYPVVDRQRIHKLERALKASGIANIQLYELCIKPDTTGPGMTGSGMVVVNPTWTLASEMQAALPWLANQLADACSAQALQPSYRVEVLAAE